MPPPDPPLALRRGIDLTPNGIIRPGSPQDYRVLRAQPWAAPLIARMTHLRMWADWPTLQPSPGRARRGGPRDARRAGRRRRRRRAAGDPDALPLPALGERDRERQAGREPREGGRLPGSARRARAGQRVGRVRRRAVGALRGADGRLRGRQRAEPPAVAAGLGRRDGGRDDAHGRRGGAAPRAGRDVPRPLALGRRDAAAVHGHGARGLHGRAARGARRARLRGRDPLGLVVPQLQRRRARREPGQRAAVAAGRSLARAPGARRRPAPLCDGGRLPARGGAPALRGGARRGGPAGGAGGRAALRRSSASTPSAAWG